MWRVGREGVRVSTHSVFVCVGVVGVCAADLMHTHSHAQGGLVIRSDR